MRPKLLVQIFRGASPSASGIGESRSGGTSIFNRVSGWYTSADLLGNIWPAKSLSRRLLDVPFWRQDDIGTNMPRCSSSSVIFLGRRTVLIASNVVPFFLNAISVNDVSQEQGKKKAASACTEKFLPWTYFCKKRGPSENSANPRIGNLGISTETVRRVWSTMENALANCKN
ncbi:hypothetical protein PoB_000405600 [Plakobranchus ocellatus]|uniref:Uncharacterized protein n=1 Tax=Plakobranchus ocellatus TaxID=259542 RepID=A0AAV3Y311_9GAST|nr:hypothetical protein PoB_000405600 [Plakobranchus ocellatus]